MQRLMKLAGYRRFNFNFEDGRNYAGWEMHFTAPLTDGEPFAGDMCFFGRLSDKDYSGSGSPVLGQDYIVVTDRPSGGKLLAAIPQV